MVHWLWQWTRTLVDIAAEPGALKMQDLTLQDLTLADQKPP